MTKTTHSQYEEKGRFIYSKVMIFFWNLIIVIYFLQIILFSLSLIIFTGHAQLAK